MSAMTLFPDFGITLTYLLSYAGRSWHASLSRSGNHRSADEERRNELGRLDQILQIWGLYSVNVMLPNIIQFMHVTLVTRSVFHAAYSYCTFGDQWRRFMILITWCLTVFVNFWLCLYAYKCAINITDCSPVSSCIVKYRSWVSGGCVMFSDELHIRRSRRHVGSTTHGGHRRHQELSLCRHPCYRHHWRQQGSAYSVLLLTLALNTSQMIVCDPLQS